MIYLKTINNTVNAYSYPINNFECCISEEIWKEHCLNNDNKIINGQFVPNNIDTRSYVEKRLAEYPSLGDMTDAFCKAYEGDDTELKKLLQKRSGIKLKYPKE